MAQDLSYVVVGGAFTLFGATIGFCGALYVNYRQREYDKKQREEDKRKEVSKAFLDESLVLLERAYETFTRLGTNPPSNDRVLWLSAARMMVRFRKMRGRLTESEHCEIADEHEEYWRLRFYTLIQDNKKNFTMSYLAPRDDVSEADVVPRRAIAVIFDFANWKEGMEDPLDVVDEKELFARGAVPIDFFHVIEFLERYETFWKKVMRIRESRRR
jgi:hypothetical protein